MKKNQLAVQATVALSMATPTFALSLLLVAAGCGHETLRLSPVPFDGSALVGQRFHSAEELPINEHRGAPRAHWSLSFDEHVCTWGYFDVNINLAYMINASEHLAMSYPPKSKRGEGLKNLFLNYRGR